MNKPGLLEEEIGTDKYSQGVNSGISSAGGRFFVMRFPKARKEGRGRLESTERISLVY